jgi:uncharacterized lipoprotein YddW (UPF0748 family)
MRPRPLRAGSTLVALLAAFLLAPPGEPPRLLARDEVRALWVQRTSLTSREAIARVVDSARAAGFTSLLVQVRGRGDALFARAREPRSALLDRADPTFDPLATVLTLGHAAGLQVHAWINVNLVASAVDLPTAASHVALRHPEWLMVPRQLADELAATDPTSPAYLGQLARWSRTEPGIEGLYLSPIPAEAARYTAAVVEDLVTRYPVDGVHFDYIRYPRADFDYSRLAVAEFRASVAPRLSAAERHALDTRQAQSLLAYPEALPEAWGAFRRSRLTALVMRLRTLVKTHRPTAVVSAAVVPDAVEAREQRLQDWRTWVDDGLVDVVCPMLYAPESARFINQLQAAVDLVGGHRLWAGIGAFRLPPAAAVDRILTARRLGATGVVLFSYETLAEPPGDPSEYLREVAHGAFADPASHGLR